MRFFLSWLILILGLSLCASNVVKVTNATNNDALNVTTRPFFTSPNETLNAEKLLFSPLSVDSSSSSVSSSLEELKRYDPKSEVENIQNDDKSQSNTDLEEQYMISKDWNPSSIVEDYTEVDHPHLKHRDIAIIAAMMLAVLCLFSYAGLVFWRRSLEKRYGGLERLITEDDFTVDNI